MGGQGSPAEASPGRRRAIIAAYVLVVVLTVAVLVWFSVLLLLNGSVELVPRIVTTGAMTLLITVPIALGSIVIGWLVDPRSPEGRRSFIRLMLVGLVIELFSGALLIGAAVASNASVFWPIVVALVSLLLTATGVAFAEAVRRATQRRAPRRTTLDGFTPEDVRKKIRAIVLTVVVTVCIAGLVTVVVSAWRGRGEVSTTTVLFIISLAFIAISCSCLVVTRNMPAQIRAIFGGDAGLQRRVTGAVLKNVRDPADADLIDTDAATEVLYSRLMAVYLPFQFLQLGGLALSLVANRLVSALDGSDRVGPWVNVVLLALFGVAVGVIVFSSGRRLRRVLARVRAADAAAQRAETPSVGPAGPVW
ncbi:hypothetical protein [Plantibacter sp. YIM 135347]|uniref:hypothetical protein n=1 Tax=Plantibacter sp. YIM 135347 TaxID=3423919 RepID=UPI003D347F0C